VRSPTASPPPGRGVPCGWGGRAGPSGRLSSRHLPRARAGSARPAAPGRPSRARSPPPARPASPGPACCRSSAAPARCSARARLPAPPRLRGVWGGKDGGGVRGEGRCRGRAPPRIRARSEGLTRAVPVVGCGRRALGHRDRMPMPTLTEDGPLSLEGRGYPPVPKLPGFHNNQENARPRPQNLRFVNGIPGNYGDVRTRPQSAPVARGRGARKEAVAPAPAPVAPGSRPGTAAPSRVPAWLAFDRQVLRYYAFFKEAVTESPSEEWRLRKCTIMYYLEDGTLQVSEPKVDNSGIPQGTFLRRHRVAKPQGGFVTFQDLNIGTTLNMYSRSFSIAGCDGFTREFLETQGERPPANMAFPEDPYLAKKAEREAATQQRRGMTETSQTFFSVGMKNQNFFRNDRKVLRFFATWDDTGSLFGDRRAFILHYYLSDDSVEILEVAQRNSGRDAFPLLLHRMRLPKHLYEVGVRPMSASARAKARHQYYHFSDLRIGSTVRVYGRDLLLHDCDEFTQNWFLNNTRGLTVADFTALPVPTAAASRPEPQVPPRDAFTIGSDEDTIANCVSLVPKQPLRDMHHFIANEGKVMRFTARFADLPPAYSLHSPADGERNFIVSFFLVDGSLQIFEPPQRNSGVMAGKFLERSAVYKPGAGRHKYRATDFGVGAVIVASGRAFRLVEADEYTLNYMEEHPDTFPQADHQRVLQKLRLEFSSPEKVDALRAQLIRSDADGLGDVAAAQLSQILADTGAKPLSTQEAVTLARYLGGKGEGFEFPATGLLGLLA